MISNDQPGVLILTPLKNAADCLPRYVQLIQALTYPPSLLSIGFLESDSSDNTYEVAGSAVTLLKQTVANARLWKRDFGYTMPAGVHRGHPSVQRERRAILARSRNHLLMHALDDQQWVLWLDVDVIACPADIIERLLATGRNIVQPHCVLEYGGPTFDQNAWRDRGRLHLDDLRDEGEIVPLDSVGGTMLLVRADLHRDGLIFPSVPYRPGHPQARRGEGELETEGLGILASDLGETCWGLPNLEILHRRL